MVNKDDVEALIAKGMSRQQILDKLGISSSTLSKWFPKNSTEIGLKIIELRNQEMSLKEIRKVLGCSKSTISKYITLSKIDRHGFQKIRKRRYSESCALKKAIAEEHNTSKGSKTGSLNFELRQRKREFLTRPANHKCQVCSYGRCKSALAFHHKDPLSKHFQVSSSLHYTLKRLIEEASKCVLLCHNCHHEVHEGLLDVSHLGLNYSEAQSSVL